MYGRGSMRLCDGVEQNPDFRFLDEAFRLSNVPTAQPARTVRRHEPCHAVESSMEKSNAAQEVFALAMTECGSDELDVETLS